MPDSAFLRVQFWAMVLFSIVVPCAIFIIVIHKQKLARAHVLCCGLCLVLLAGGNLILLQQLLVIAKQTTDLMDDLFFASEYSLALYVLPLVSAALGTDLLSHVITSRLVILEHTDGK